jgi:hypothetical protein
MNNPFNLQDDKLLSLLSGYKSWLDSNPEEAKYPEDFRRQAEDLRNEFLSKEALAKMSDDDFYNKIYKYSRSLEGPAYIRLGEPRIKSFLKDLRRNLLYIITTEDSPFEVAQNVLDGKYKIELFAKSFWSPILHARFPGVLPNWNNKTERFLKKFGIKLSTSKISISEKYKLLSNSFKYLSELSSGQDFFNINHLMHYGTEIQEGIDIIDKLQGTKSNDPILELIKVYKENLKKTKLQDELYKWELVKKYKGRPDLDAKNFYEEVKAIEYRNLMYEMAVVVKNHIAKDLPDEYKLCYRKLFDNYTDLNIRVKGFMTDVLNTYRKLEPKYGHHHDERTIATILTYYDPESYTFFKDSFYQKYCKLIGVEAKEKGEKYAHYLELIDDLCTNYINSDSELIKLVVNCMNSDCFEDNKHLILAQDILFQNLEKEGLRGRRYWRIGTTDDKGQYWDEMQSNQVVSIGWSELGDLSEKNIETRNDISKLMEDIGYYDNLGLRNRKAGEVLNFYQEMNNGDVVVAQDGQKVIALGIINDDYLYQQELHFPHTRSVDWKVIGLEDLTNQQGLRTTVFPIDDPLMINKIDKFLFGNEIKESISIYNSPKNIILYGPPGTGKTYKLRNEYIKDFTEEKTQTKVDFCRELVRDLTWWEVIGVILLDLKEATIELIYTHELFKARIPFSSTKTPRNTLRARLQRHTLEDCPNVNILRKDSPLFIWKDKSGNWSAKDEVVKEEAPQLNEILVRYRSFKPEVMIKERFVFTTFHQSFSYEDFVEGIKPVLTDENESAEDNELRYEIKDGVLKRIVKDALDDPDHNYAIFIDEINRGNIANIFGELITLIEEDKRIGSKNYIPATLPYSKKEFGVPPKLFFIGTMNTADRSIESLDTALRRRFSFIEVPPSPAKLSLPEFKCRDIDLEKLLDSINQRIEVILDKDHRIGHSFFMKINDRQNPLEDLKRIFQRNILPLLQEYFYGDWGKIMLVLGSGFISKKTNSVKFLSTDQYEDFEEIESRPVYSFTDPETWTLKVFKNLYE